MCRHELRYGLGQKQRLVSVWGMSAARYRYHDCISKYALDAIYLFHRPVLVVLALHREQRAADVFQIGFNRPMAKSRRQPDIVPSEESRIHIVVVAGEPLA